MTIWRNVQCGLREMALRLPLRGNRSLGGGAGFIYQLPLLNERFIGAAGVMLYPHLIS